MVRFSLSTNWLCAHREARTQYSCRAAATHARPLSTSVLREYLTPTPSTFLVFSSSFSLVGFNNRITEIAHDSRTFWQFVDILLAGRTSGKTAGASSNARAAAGRAVATRFKWSRVFDTAYHFISRVPYPYAALCIDSLELHILKENFYLVSIILHVL